MADYAKIIAALGNYHRKKPEMIANFQKFFGMTSRRYLKSYDTIKDELPLVTDFLGDIVQKGDPNKSWNPTTNAYSFDARILKVRDFEINLEENPLALAKNALAEFQQAGTNPRNYWFEEIFMQKVQKQLLQNLERIVWRGVYNATATPVGVADTLTVADGVEQLVTSNIALCNVVTTGTVDDTNAFSKLNNIWRAVPPDLKNDGAKMYVPPTVFDSYLTNQNNRNINYTNLWASMPSKETDGDQTSYKPLYLDSSGGMCEIVPIKAKQGTNRIICDPAGVLAMGTDLFTDFFRFEIDRASGFKKLNIFAYGRIGVQAAALQIGTNRYLTVSDVA